MSTKCRLGVCFVVVFWILKKLQLDAKEFIISH